ncbi:MAG: winged helix-turn-helix transcriptional regulator [Myxococcota bacterium]
MDLLKGKWTIVILARLKEGPHSYAELRRAMSISDKMLTTRLRELEERELIQREDRKYLLARRGESLRQVLDAIYRWGLEEAARAGVRLDTNRSVR